MKRERGKGLQLVLARVAIAMAATAGVGCAREPDGAEISIAPDAQAIVNVTRVSFQAIVPSLGGQPTYHWDFGDGEKGSGKVVEHVYRMEGRLPVTLTVEQLSRSAPGRTDRGHRGQPPDDSMDAQVRDPVAMGG